MRRIVFIPLLALIPFAAAAAREPQWLTLPALPKAAQSGLAPTATSDGDFDRLGRFR